MPLKRNWCNTKIKNRTVRIWETKCDMRYVIDTKYVLHGSPRILGKRRKKKPFLLTFISILISMAECTFFVEYHESALQHLLKIKWNWLLDFLVASSYRTVIVPLIFYSVVFLQAIHIKKSKVKTSKHQIKLQKQGT